MTQRSKWMPGPQRYLAWQRQLQWLAKAQGYVLDPDKPFSATFYIPMPKSWSKKKREAMRGERHQQKPDLSNLVKAVEDALLVDDCKIWKYKDIEKRWADEGSIEILEA